MKKYTKKPKWLQYMRRRKRRSLEAQLRFRSYLKQKHREESGISATTLALRKQIQQRSIFITKVEAPTVLSLVRNPEAVCAFVASLKDCFSNKKPVFVVLKNVIEIDYDGITVLLSVMIRFKSKCIDFNGDFPDDKNVRKTLEDSRFFDHLKGTFRDEETYTLTDRNSILTHAMKTVDSELGEKLIGSASQTVWGERRRCPGVQRTFIELMQNTNNHASLDKEGDKHWWLCVKHIKERKRVAFSFLDYGVGVFYNLKNKRQENKFFGILEKLYERWRYGNNSEVLKLIFLGELHRTASGKSFRGKGLPGVYESLQNNKISNFSMITNNVYYNSNGDEYRILKNEFEGTFIYWELTEYNESLNYEN
jgi:hypothetical protein